MKTALILTGHMRDTIGSGRINTIIKYIIEPLDADVYGWFWSDTGFKLNDGKCVGVNSSGVVPGNFFNFEPLRKIIPNIQLSINDYKSYYNKFLDDNSRLNEFIVKYKEQNTPNRPVATRSQWFTWREAFAMVDRSGIEYDLVIRTRPQINLLSELPETDQLNTVHFAFYGFPGRFGEYPPLQDFISYGGMENMRKFCSLYDHWNEYIEEMNDTPERFEIMLNPHRLYSYHCKQQGIITQTNSIPSPP